MKRELIKFRKWWNENKSKLSIKITVRDIDDYLSTLPDEKGCETCKYDPQKNKICLTCDDHYSKYKSNQP